MMVISQKLTNSCYISILSVDLTQKAIAFYSIAIVKLLQIPQWS
ncbi:hypothetical protein [Pseudanabaena cinerea]|nr:hypothetical protein [Pseudanabaena cinerea]